MNKISAKYVLILCFCAFLNLDSVNVDDDFFQIWMESSVAKNLTLFHFIFSFSRINVLKVLSRCQP
jgi:hypothetical protein